MTRIFTVVLLALGLATVVAFASEKMHHFPNGATSHPTTPDGKRLPPPQAKAER